MRLIARVLAALVLAVAMLGTASVSAGSGDLTAEAGDPGDETDGGDGGVYVVSCDYFDERHSRNGRYESEGYIFLYIDASWFRFLESTGEAWIRSWEVCDLSDGSTRSRSVWRLISDPDPGIIIGPAYDKVVKRIDPPVPDLSPPGPGVVNLGMWLAVADPPENPVVARAVARTVWAEVTGRLATTTFDFGNGDSITCDGAGTPIPDSELDSLDAGPCGYTFTTPSGDDPYTVTVTATWEVTYELSDGRTGSRPDIVLTATVPYDVVEIQTVGTRG